MPALTTEKQRMQSFYDEAAPSYLRRDEGPKQLFYNSLEFSFVKELDLRGQLILDVGAGTGRFPLFARDAPRYVVGGDLSFQMLEVAVARCQGQGKVGFVQMDGEALPFGEQTFDLITCFGLFEYVQILEPYFREFHRAGRPGSHLVFTCRNAGAFWQASQPAYQVVEHAWRDLEASLERAGFALLRHQTIYHLNGRWIWLLCRSLAPLGLSYWFVRRIVAWNARLSAWPVSAASGKTHLVAAVHR